MLLLTKDQVRYDRAQNIYVNENASPPPAGTQIFCGNLPRNMRETELFPYFSLIGEIYEFRLMMEFSGFSRGFCFVTYMQVDQADQAIRSLHGYVLKDRELAVYKSWNNTKLFIYGIPYSVTPARVKDDLKLLFPGLVNVLCKTDNNNTASHKGWAFLEFDCHRNASQCRKKIWPNKLMAWGSLISTEWARPIRSISTRDRCTLQLMKVPETLDKNDIYNLVSPFLKADTLVQIYKGYGRTTAKLEFNSVPSAETAFKSLQGLKCNGVSIFVCKYTDYAADINQTTQYAQSSSNNDCYDVVDDNYLSASHGSAKCYHKKEQEKSSMQRSRQTSNSSNNDPTCLTNN